MKLHSTVLSQGGGVVTATPPELLPEVLQCHNGKVHIPESLALLTTSAHAMLGQAFAPCTCPNILCLQECQWTRLQQPLRALQSWHS